MEFYYLVNYYFKYLELLDTIFLAFKKKPLRELLAFTLPFSRANSSCQSFFTFSTILPLPSSAGRNSTEKRALWVCKRLPFAQADIICQSWTVISLNLAVHVLMCTCWCSVT
jgi:hypothetical protein